MDEVPFLDHFLHCLPLWLCVLHPHFFSRKMFVLIESRNPYRACLPQYFAIYSGYTAHPLCCWIYNEYWRCMIYYFSPLPSLSHPSAAGTPFSLCCIPWEWLGNCWLSMQRCRMCRRQACTLSLSPTNTTSLSTTTPSSSSSWSPTSPVSQHAD